MSYFEDINSKIKNYMDNDTDELYEETTRIANYAVEIAESVFMKSEDKELLYLIASVYSVGKAHKENTITLLFDKGEIRKILKTEQNDDLIRDVIYAISQKIVPDFYDGKSKEFIHIINDAINLNKLYKMSVKKIIIDESDKINKNILADFTNNRECKKIDVHSQTDGVIYTFSHIFNFRYKYSFYEIEKLQIIEKTIENLNLKNELVIDLFEQLKKIMMKYIKSRIGETYHGW